MSWFERANRLRDLVQTTGDLDLAIRHGVPRSMARGWRSKTTTEVVSMDVLELDTIQLQHEVILLRRRIARLGSLLRLVVIVLKVSGISCARVRLMHTPRLATETTPERESLSGSHGRRPWV